MSGAAALAAVETAVSHGLAMLLFAFGATASETGIIDTAGRRRRSAATYPRQPLGAAVQRPARPILICPAVATAVPQEAALPVGGGHLCSGPQGDDPAGRTV